MITPYSSAVEQQMKTFYTGLKERERRHYAALEAVKLQHGGKKYIQTLLNIHHKTLKRAMDELSNAERYLPLFQRINNGVRAVVEKKTVHSPNPSPTSRPDRPT
jgi:hypothetical protein